LTLAQKTITILMIPKLDDSLRHLRRQNLLDSPFPGNDIFIPWVIFVGPAEA